MASTRQTHLTHRRGRRALPPRTPGPLGHADAASLDAGMCEPGDTSGPVGTGGDAAALSCLPEGPPGDLYLIDEDIVMSRIRRCAYFHLAALTLAGGHPEQWYRDDEFDRMRFEEARSELIADLKKEWATAKRTSGEAMISFFGQVKEVADADYATVMKVYGQLQKEEAGYRHGVANVVRGLIVIKGLSTIVRKVAAALTGPVGTGIDIGTDLVVASQSDDADAVEKQALEDWIELLIEEGSVPAARGLLKTLHGALSATEEALLDELLKDLEASGSRVITRATLNASIKSNQLLLRLARMVATRKKAVMAPLGKAYAALKNPAKMSFLKGSSSAQKYLGKATGAGLVIAAYEVTKTWNDMKKELEDFHE